MPVRSACSLLQWRCSRKSWRWRVQIYL